MVHNRLRDGGGLPGINGTVVLVAVVSLLHVAPAPSLADTPGDDSARHYGFDTLEVYRLDKGITQLRTADFNGDGAVDIAVTNNAKSVIELLLQRCGKAAEPEKARGVNDLVNPERFERKKISVTWQVVCLRAADVTGDGKVDLIITGDPKELVVLPGQGDGNFGQPITRRIPDLLATQYSMDVADLNGDGRLDIVVLGESDLIVHFQPPQGGVGNSTRFAHAMTGAMMVTAADINGDGRADLAMLCNDDAYPLRVQFQSANGQLGPLHRVKLPPLRSLVFASCLGRSQQDLFGIERVSGRVKRWVYEQRTAANPEEKWSVHVYPLPGKGADQLPVALGDLTGDKRADVVSANVDAAQLMLFAQAAGGGLQLPEAFGGQIAMRDMCSFDADGNGIDELYVLSPQEQTIARSVFEGGRLTFPKPLAAIGTPQVLSMTRDANGRAIMAYVTKNEGSKFQLIVQPVEAKPAESMPADAKAAADAGVVRVDLTGIEDAPTAVRWADVNQDGRDDLLVFVPFGPLRTVIRQADGTFKVLAASGQAQTGLVKDATPCGFAYADTNGDGVRDVVVTQKTFVRALRVNKSGAWEVVDQYNAPTTDAEITGVCLRPVPGRKRPDLVMYDRKSQGIHCFVPSGDDLYTLDRSVQVGSLDLKAMQAAPLGGDGNSSILLADKKRLVLVLPEVPAMRMDEVGAYESSIEQAVLRQVAVGDLNHDGRTDVAVTDAREHFVEILTFDADNAFVRATKFRLFARKQREAGEQDKGEPQWMSIADVTGDGNDDLVFIAHDRILLYPGQ